MKSNKILAAFVIAIFFIFLIGYFVLKNLFGADNTVVKDANLAYVGTGTNTGTAQPIL